MRQFRSRLPNFVQNRIDGNLQNSGNIPNSRIIQSHRDNQRTNKRTAALIRVIGNKLLATIFAPILLLFIPSFAILFKIERSAM